MLTFNADSLRLTVRQYILANHLFTDDPSALNDDESFQETRQIDSMGMMQLIQFLESSYDIKIHDHEMVPEELDSVNRIVRLVARKQRAA